MSRYSQPRPGPNGERPWSKQEDDILQRYYPREGTHGVLSRLERAGFTRTRPAVTSRAHNKMIAIGDIEGYIPVSKLTATLGQTQYYRVLWLACKDGVLLEIPSRRLKYLVPIEWADTWFEKRMKNLYGEEE